MQMRYEHDISDGPWGGSLGKSWVYRPKGPIEKIRILYGEVIDRIILKSTTSGRSFGFGSKYGSQQEATISIDWPNEYLTSISGTIGSFGGSDVVTSLCFHTNRKSHGPYGCDTGTPFSYQGKGKVITGFHGHAAKYVDAIGIYIMTLPLAPSHSASKSESESKETCRIEKPYWLPTTGMERDAGPWGACGGHQWDDGIFSKVKGLRLYIGESLKVIYGIKFEYIRNDGQFVLSPVHGAENGDIIKEVCFDDEYLSGISGFYGPLQGYMGLEGVTSITFHTNKQKHGPFGQGRGDGYVSFTSTSSPGKVLGFHGRSAAFLSAIGVHMEYFP